MGQAGALSQARCFCILHGLGPEKLSHLSLVVVCREGLEKLQNPNFGPFHCQIRLQRKSLGGSPFVLILLGIPRMGFGFSTRLRRLGKDLRPKRVWPAVAFGPLGFRFHTVDDVNP